jgi:hypothetical protein
MPFEVINQCRGVEGDSLVAAQQGRDHGRKAFPGK